MLPKRKTPMKIHVALLCALGYAASSAAATSTPAPAGSYTAEAMWQLQRLGAPAISPDGRQAVLPVTHYDVQNNQTITDLWLVPTKPGKARQLTNNGGHDASPRWSPDGHWIAFIARRTDDKQPQVYVIAIDGGEARRVTNVATGATAPKWFPDSQRIAFLSRVWAGRNWDQMTQRVKERDETRMTAKVFERAPISYWDHFLDDRQTHVFAVSIEGGEVRSITSNSGHALDAADPDEDSYDISPDGSEIAFASDVDTSGVDQNFDIFTLTLESAEAHDISSDNPANDVAPLYSPDGKHLAFTRQRIKDFYADKSRLMIYERRSHELRTLTENWDRSVSEIVWSPQSDGLFGSIDDAGTHRIYHFDLSSDLPKALTRESSFGSLTIAGNGPVIVALRQSFTEPPTLVSIIPRNGAATRLSDFNDAALAKMSQGKVESSSFTGANGDAIQSWIVYPPNFTPTRKWPLLLLIHGGPHNGITDAVQWRWNAQVFANWGYVVAWYNFHGSSGFGQAFADSITREWADLPYQDTIKAADWFKAQPWIDANRMAAGGGSYGGYLTTVLLGREHPFKTLIAHAAVFDFYSQTATDDGAQKHRYGEYWDDPERMLRNSPHFNAAHFKTPTLVIHGQQDLRVPVNNGIELFNALQNRGVASKFVYFPDENHWILKPQNSLFWYDTVRNWLATYVPPGPDASLSAPIEQEH